MGPDKSTRKTGTVLNSKLDKASSSTSRQKESSRFLTAPSSSRHKSSQLSSGRDKLSESSHRPSSSSRPSASGGATKASRTEYVAPSTSSSRRESTQRPGSIMRPLDSKTSTRKTGTVMRPLDDAAMATRQLTINKLTEEEREIQEAWAQRKIQILGVCPASFRWLRSDGPVKNPTVALILEPDCGYRCSAGGHYISDRELASGKTAGEIFNDQNEKFWRKRQEKFPGLFPTIPRHGPPSFSDPYSRRPW